MSAPGYDDQYGGGAKGLLTGTRTYQLAAPDKYTVSASYYDHRGRIVQTHATNHLGGFEDEYTAYNFIGTVKQRQHVHSAAGKAIQTEVYSYTYDQADRLLTVSYKLNGFPENNLQTNTYDETGRLHSRKKATETSTFSYNVRSWMTGISGQLFNETLAYNTAVEDVNPQTATFNGNISAMRWKAGTENVFRGYQFGYDPCNRLTKALYGEGSNIAVNNNYNVEVAYGKMGSMKSLYRRGKSEIGFA